MLMTNKGQSVRIRVGGDKGISEQGRNAQGVKLMNLSEGELIQDVAAVVADELNGGELEAPDGAAPPEPPEAVAE